MWSVAAAKAELSEILRRARAGEPQVIGARAPCVVVSEETYQTQMATHDGRWLIDLAARVGCDIPLPARNEDRESAFEP
jgi:prevent-host-death family protein